MTPNFTSNYRLSETSNILKFERDLIKTWAYKFSEHLQPHANLREEQQHILY